MGPTTPECAPSPGAHTRAGLVLLIACVLASRLALGCSATPAPPHALNVLWIVIDATRADFVGAYGNELPTTPRIDSLAREATLFERAYSQATWTLPSTASFLSGRYPEASMEGNKLAPGQTLAVSLKEAGMRTAAFSENPYVIRTLGFADGFDVFREYFPHRLIEKTPRRYSRTDTGRTIEDVVDWIEEDPDDPFFAYLHLLPPHAPYDPPPPFGGRFDPGYRGRISGQTHTLLAINEGKRRISARDLEHLRLQYQENLAFADHQIGRLLDALSESQLTEQTLVIVTSDHGEAFLEHGFLLHNFSLYEEVIHVPLLIRFPERFGALPRRWPGVVELRQIAPTVCEVLGVDACPRHAESLLQTIQEQDEASGVALSFSTSRAGKPLSGVVSQNHKLVRGPGQDPQLFDLGADPEETRNVIDTQTETAEELERRFHELASDRVETQEQPLDEETREQLRALGYAE